MPDPGGTRQLVPDFRLRINGAELPARARADLLSVAVHEDVDAPGMFTFRLITWDMAQLRVTWADDDLMSVGNEVEIMMGYVDRLQPLMAGEITGLEPEFSGSEAPTLTVRGYDRRHRLMRGRKTHSFIDMTDGDIAGKVASDAGLSAQTDPTSVKLDYVLQHNQTDLEFLQDRARRIGFEVVVEGKTLLFRKRQNAAAEVLTLTRETDLLAFHPRLTTLGQTGEMTVRGWNVKDKATVVGKAATGDETSTMGGSASGPAAAKKAFGASNASSVSRPVSSQAEADQIARGRFNDMALAYISGEGVCIGRTDLRAGKVVKIEGLGRRFSGLYYVAAATHTYTPGAGYRTAITVRRNAS